MNSYSRRAYEELELIDFYEMDCESEEFLFYYLFDRFLDACQPITDTMFFINLN